MLSARLKLGLWLIGALILAACGIPLMALPAHEISYSEEFFPALCTAEENCIQPYKIYVANTGRRSAREVKITVASRALDKTIIPLRVRYQGIRECPFELSRQNEISTINLNNLEAGRRVDLDLVFGGLTADKLPKPGSVVRQIESSEKVVVRANPEAIRLGRFFFGLLSF